MSSGDLAELSIDVPLSPRKGLGGHPGLGLVLVGAALIQFIGQFTRYATVTPPPASGFDFPVHAYSYSLWSGLNWQGLPTFNAGLLTLALAGALFAVRPSSGRAAFIVGFAGGDVAGVGYALLTVVRTPGSLQWGAGYFLNVAGTVVEACVAVVLFVSLWRSIRASRPLSRVTLQLVVGCAILVGFSSAIWPIVVNRGESIARYSPWSIGSAALAVVAFAAVAALPVLAARLGDRTGAYITTGIAVGLTLAVFDAFMHRFSDAFVAHRLTVGFWCDIAAIGLLLVLGRQLRRSADTDPDDERSTPLTP